MAITLRSLNAPTNLQASAGGGGSIPVGTYYVCVVAYNYAQTTADNEDSITRLKSPVSAESQVTLTSGFQTLNISWDAVPGAQSYKVYVTTSPPGNESRWSATGVKNVNGTTSTTSPTTNLTSVTLVDTTNMFKPGTDWISYPYALPSGLNKNSGSCIIVLSGTCGSVILKNIYDALPAGQCAFDEQQQRFSTIASIVIEPGATGSMSFATKTLDFLHCSYANNSGGSFLTSIENAFLNLAGTYGTMALSPGDTVRNSAFKMGIVAGFKTDSTNMMLGTVKRLYLREYADGGGNWFSGTEIDMRSGSKSNVMVIGPMYMAAEFNTEYFLDGLKTIEGQGNLTKIEYNYWNQYNSKLKIRESELGTTNGTSSGYHIYIGTPDTINPFEFFDNVYKYVDTDVPTIFWAKGENYDATNNTAKIYNSFAVTVSDVDGILINSAVCALFDVFGYQMFGLSNNGIFDFGYVFTASLKSSTPGVAGQLSTITDRNPFVLKCRKYGFVCQQLTIGIKKPKTNNAIVLNANPFTQSDEATAGAYTGISVDGENKTITITEPHTMQEIYDYSQWWACQADNRIYDEPITTYDGSNFTLAEDWDIIIDGAAISASGRKLATSGTGTYSLINDGDFTGILATETDTRVPIVVSGIVPGSRLQLYDLTTSAEIFNSGVDATSLTSYFTHTGTDHDIRMRLMYVSGTVAKKWHAQAGTVTTTGLTFNAVQVDDPVYNAVNIDGSLVTECSIAGSVIRIYVDDPDNTTQAQRIYNWYMYYLSTQSGIAEQNGDCITATDATHFTFDNSMKIVNQNATSPLEITGANITPVSGSAGNIFDVSNGASIILNFNRVEGFAFSSGSGLSTEEHNQLMSYVPTKTDLDSAMSPVAKTSDLSGLATQTNLADAILPVAKTTDLSGLPTLDEMIARIQAEGIGNLTASDVITAMITAGLGALKQDERDKIMAELATKNDVIALV